MNIFFSYFINVNIMLIIGVLETSPLLQLRKPLKKSDALPFGQSLRGVSGRELFSTPSKDFKMKINLFTGLKNDQDGSRK